MMRYSLLISSLFFAVSAFAVPAKRICRTITLPDGSQKVAVQMGDEFGHYFQTADGVKYAKQADGTYSVLSQNVLDKAQLRRIAVNKSRTARAEKVRKALANNSSSRTGQHKATWGATSNPVSGTKRGLVILVNFSDKTMASSHTQTEFNNYFNQEGYSSAGMTGSVHDYFYNCSYGKFDLEFDVVGPVTVSKGYSYYGSNDSDGNDKCPGTMVCEAVKLADGLGVDFSKYDWDNDGEVDQIYLIYAGYGEAQGASDYTIWPHEWDLESAKEYGDGTGPLTYDGVKINTYAVSCELRGISGSVIDGIGTACHEFSHCMAIPDFYDTDGSNFAMDVWDLMDYGCYNGPSGYGESPWGFTSYERMYCGWLTPTEISDFTEIADMQPLYNKPEAYIIYNKANSNEYYMLENRQLTGMDKYGSGHGLVVLHVDFDKDAWINNTVNNTASHQRMTIIAADNKYNLNDKNDMDGDPFPGTSNNTELTNTSTPKASLYNVNIDGQKLMNMPLRQIAENTSDGTISFLAGNLSAPVALDASDVSSKAFTANWTSVDNSESYQIELIQKDTVSADPSEAILLNEDFSGFASLVSNATDYSTNLDSYTNVSGWTGLKVFGTGKCAIKIGSGSSVGKLVTPTLSITSDKITIVVGCKKYGTDSGKLNVSVGDVLVQSITPTSDYTNFTFTADASSDCKVTLATSTKRCYINKVAVYDGEFTEEQLTDASLVRTEVLADVPTDVARKATTRTTYDTDKSSYSFSDLDAAYRYSYRVRAYNSTYKIYSDWSNTIKIDLSTGIKTVKSTSLSTVSPLYDLNGRIVKNPTLHGIYIREGKKVFR